MAKEVFKQIIIGILIILLIALILAIIFYQFIPTNKVIPTEVTSYKTPESVKSEINENVTEQEFSSVNEVFEITDSDLSIYQAKKSYNPGKSDPFKEYSASDAEADSSDEETNSSSSSSTTVENRNTTDNYYKQSGIGTSGK